MPIPTERLEAFLTKVASVRGPIWPGVEPTRYVCCHQLVSSTMEWTDHAANCKRRQVHEEAVKMLEEIKHDFHKGDSFPEKQPGLG